MGKKTLEEAKKVSRVYSLKDIYLLLKKKEKKSDDNN